jgi:hypothetical protein
MSGVSSSAINKTAIPESQTPTANSSKFGTALNATPQKISSNTQESPTSKVDPKAELYPQFDGTMKRLSPRKAAAENKIILRGIPVPRFTSQEAMTKHRTKQQLLDIGMDKHTSYIIDDFKTKDIKIGYAQKRVGTSHGDLVSGRINAEFYGVVKIVKMNNKVENKAGVDNIAVLKSLNYIIEDQCKIQKKDRKNVDLSDVSVNMSFGSDYKEVNASPYAIEERKLNIALVAEITERGGQVFIPAGNEYYNAEAEKYKETFIADGSNEIIGQDNSSSPKPMSGYKNLGERDGKDVRSERPIDPSSASRILPSEMITRVAKNGDIEFKDKYNKETGWTKLVDAKNTVPLKTPDTSIERMDFELESKIPTSKVTANDFTKFRKWCADLKKASTLSKEAIRDVTTAEYFKRFGESPVISLQEVITYLKLKSGDTSYEAISGNIPDGLSAKDTYVSFTALNTGNLIWDTNDLKYFVQDKNNKLKAVERDVTRVIGTSYAAPTALIKSVGEQHEIVTKVIKSRSEPNARTKITP